MHKYVVTLKELDSFNANLASACFEVSNHDDLLRIIEAVRAKQIFDKDKSAALALGLKLFLEVVLEKRRIWRLPCTQSRSLDLAFWSWSSV